MKKLVLSKQALVLIAWISSLATILVTGFAGAITELCDAYASNTADLITHGLGSAAPSSASEDSREWMWAQTGSKEFFRAVAPSLRVKTAEHVQRFSVAFLQWLHYLSANGVTAWSEMGIPSLCAYVGGCTSTFLPEHIGHTYSFDGRVTHAQWKAIREDGSQRHRLFHALKW